MEKNLNGIFLSIDKMQKLKSYGLDTSDAKYCYVKKKSGYSIEDCETYKDENPQSPPMDMGKLGKLCWIEENGKWFTEPYEDYYKRYDSLTEPVYTLEELLRKIPHRIECFDEELAFDFEMWPSLNKEDGKVYWILAFIPDENCPDDVMELNYVVSENLLDGAYEMLLWCLKYNYIKL